jgi:NAD(P)-dependent dehydrogenase (short-subunit alcohol dehydrogenase family)
MSGASRAAIVTGAGRGIGRGIAQALGRAGWTVVVNYHSDASAAAQTAGEIEQSGGRALPLQADIAQSEGRTHLVDETLKELGRIDLLVNNAGIAPRQRADLLETGEESWDEILGTNLKGPFFLTQRIAREMIRLLEDGRIQRPKIVNLGSLSSYTSSTSRGEYCISKAGISMMTALFADRLAQHGIQVFEVRPGIVDTDMTRAVKEKYDRLFAEGLAPMKRWGTPEDVGRAVLAIAEDYFPYSTGEIINVDGGFHMHRL